MACDAATLEALAVLTNKENGLSERDIQMCTASVIGTAAGFHTAQAALNTAISNGYQKLSERDLRAFTLYILCAPQIQP